ncbi:hypothetical protein ACHQM5_004519 [Ranunculus cassubicifolius]
MSSSDEPSSNSNATVGRYLLPRASGPIYLPTGVRFSPSDVEIANVYLKNRAFGIQLPSEVIIQKDGLYSTDPDELGICEFKNAKDNQAYFFTYDGNRSNKTYFTTNGYWETLKEGQVLVNGEVLAYKKTLVFYWGIPHQERVKTSYVMKEFRLNPSLQSDDATIRNNIENLVLCKVRLWFPRVSSSDTSSSADFSEDGSEDDSEDGSEDGNFSEDE